MSDPEIYLAGPVEQTRDPRTWRDVVKLRYPQLTFIDPMDWQAEWDADPHGVIQRELETCERAAILAANIGRDGPRTVGTHHEIAHALAHGNDRVAVVSNGRVPGFIEHRVAVFDTIEEALAHLVGEPVQRGGASD